MYAIRSYYVLFAFPASVRSFDVPSRTRLSAPGIGEDILNLLSLLRETVGAGDLLVKPLAVVVLGLNQTGRLGSGLQVESIGAAQLEQTVVADADLPAVKIGKQPGP